MRADRHVVILACVVSLLACHSSHDGSALCGISGADSCGMNQLCSQTFGCVECVVGSDCPQTLPRCVEGECQQCGSNADCGAAMPACWADGQCHPSCGSGSGAMQCPQQANLDVCDTATGDCVGCESDTNCAGTAKPLCEPTLEECVACLQNSDCGVAAPYCFLGDHTCVVCVSNADCPSDKPICSDRDFQCRAGCTTDSQCMAPTPFCDTSTSQCVACVVGSDCPVATPVCDTGNGTCIVCGSDGDCKEPGKPICDQQRGADECVQCVRDTDCGSAMPHCLNNVCGP
jgi:hypothetical protein